MEMQNIILEDIPPSEYLHKIAGIVLDKDASKERMDNALLVMHTLFASLSGIKGAIRDDTERYETSLPTGCALSPGYAADCLLDTYRTVKYIRALDSAIKKIREKGVGAPVHILYAGSGPFAPFVLPLTTCYSPDEITITVLDIHKRSIDGLKKVIAATGTDRYFRELVVCDATTYQHTGKPFHIFITETMHKTLSREPHLMICKNLAPQLVEGGIMIPERVSLLACCSTMETEINSFQRKIPREEVERERQVLGPVIELTRDAIYQVTEDGEHIQGEKIRIPGDAADNNVLVILTEIMLFDSLQLNELESGITFPYLALDLEKLQPNDLIDFKFRIRGLPGIEYTRYKEIKL